MRVPEYLRKKIMRRAKLAEEFNNLIRVIDNIFDNTELLEVCR